MVGVEMHLGTHISIEKNSSVHFVGLRTLSYRSVTARFIYGAFLALFFFSLFVGTAPANERNRHPVSGSRGVPFSIADFDGDQKPDFASVQAGHTDSSLTYYSIQLRLTAAGPQTIQIVAPMGGLDVVSRDVNGDHALDLVLTTKWLQQPVAILLNDGHGHFSREAPEAFPGAFSDSETGVNATSRQAADVVGIAPQSRKEVSLESAYSRPFESQFRSLTCFNSRLGTVLCLISQPGRAPPSKASHS